MAREIGRLTALDVKRAKQRGLYNDGGGLHLQIDRNGVRSWIFRYGAQGRRYLGLGPSHTITLAEAREKARDCRKLLLEGRDPIVEKQARKPRLGSTPLRRSPSPLPPRPTSATTTPRGRTRRTGPSGAIRCAITPTR